MNFAFLNTTFINPANDKKQTMDIEHPEEPDTASTPPTSELVRASEILPGTIPVLPQTERPFFPGQAIPLLMDAELWGETIKAAQENANNIIGLLLVRSNKSEQAGIDDFHRMGTACRIHRVGRQDGRMQVLLEGLQRFRVTDWLNSKAPFTARVEYFPEERYEEIPEIKAYAIAIINTIRELVPLNPLYGEEFKLFLDNFHPNDPSHLADFAASLTTSNREEQQQVLEATDLLTRLQRVHVLINKELEIARTQAQIRQQVAMVPFVADDSTAEARSCVCPVACRTQDLFAGSVDIGEGGAWADRLDGPFIGLDHRFVVTSNACRWLTHDDRPFDVAGVAPQDAVDDRFEDLARSDRVLRAPRVPL